jgi:hypothetical protein
MRDQPVFDEAGQQSVRGGLGQPGGTLKIDQAQSVLAAAPEGAQQRDRAIEQLKTHPCDSVVP